MSHIVTSGSGTGAYVIHVTIQLYNRTVLEFENDH